MAHSYPVTTYVMENFMPVPESGCWLWMGGWTDKGYGRASLPGKHSIFAHRIFYDAYVGPIPEGMMVCHKCDTPACCNPHHLFLGTAATNNADMVSKNRQRKRRGADHRCARLTEPQVRMIFSDSRSCSRVAAEYGVSITAIHRIKRGQRWKHLGLCSSAK